MAEKKHSTKFIDLSGHRFGRLTIVARAENREARARWECRCDCGNTIIVIGKGLRNGHTKSCGCFKNETTANRNRTHGHAGTVTYRAWKRMKGRCMTPSDKRFPYYGGRGIEVCERWLRFENFLEDMGERPAETSLDRIDNDGNYSPDNCRWASVKVQCNNRRRNVLITRNGVTHTLAEWAEELGIRYSTVWRRLYTLGWDIERALTP